MSAGKVAAVRVVECVGSTTDRKEDMREEGVHGLVNGFDHRFL